MAEIIADSPEVTRRWCPGCQPDADPETELLDQVWCAGHAPDRNGLDDTQALVSGVYLGVAEAGGDVNRKVCDLFHRQIPQERRLAAEATARRRA